MARRTLKIVEAENAALRFEIQTLRDLLSIARNAARTMAQRSAARSSYHIPASVAASYFAAHPEQKSVTKDALLAFASASKS